MLLFKIVKFPLSKSLLKGIPNNECCRILSLPFSTWNQNWYGRLHNVPHDSWSIGLCIVSFCEIESSQNELVAKSDYALVKITNG